MWLLQMFISTYLKAIINILTRECFQSLEHSQPQVFRTNLIRALALNKLFVCRLHYHLGFFKWDPQEKSGFTATLRVEGHTVRMTIRKSAGSHPGG